MVVEIKHLLKEKGLQFKELADKLGVSDVALRQSLNGNPTYSRLKEVADILGVEVGDLFGATKKDEIICPKCGSNVSTGAKFCLECGEKL